MHAQTIMKLLTCLAIPLTALAAPNPPSIDSYETVPFAPATPEQPAFERCTTEEHQKAPISHPADMKDCLQIGEWARANNGVWLLQSTTTDDGDDWHVLFKTGGCSLLVKNPDPTEVGNKDVADMIDAVHLGDGIRLGSVEEIGTFEDCQGDVTVSFWLRDSKF